MSTDIVKQGFAAAQKEQQEQEISKIKKIVQHYLESIQEKSDKKNELDIEIRLLKKDLDDLKAGRLDRIKERSEKDTKARDTTLIIIREVEKEYIPMRPWLSPWYVELKPFVYPNSSPIVFSGSSTNTVSLCTSGTTFSTFTGGTYTIGSNTVSI